MLAQKQPLPWEGARPPHQLGACLLELSRRCSVKAETLFLSTPATQKDSKRGFCILANMLPWCHGFGWHRAIFLHRGLCDAVFLDFWLKQWWWHTAGCRAVLTLSQGPFSFSYCPTSMVLSLSPPVSSHSITSPILPPITPGERERAALWCWPACWG